MALINQIEVADERLRPHVLETPLIPSPCLGSGVQLKLENRQHTGSFKARGALNRILEGSQSSAAPGIVAASTGNHALAVAWAAQQASLEDVLIVAPTTMTDAKKTKLACQGVELKLHGEDCIEAELHARALSEETGRTFISPYNDPLVVAGQGTVGAELLRQTKHLDAVLIAVGGGGLISGTAAMLKASRPDIEIIGCLPYQSPAMFECVRAGQVIDVPTHPTLSDGTAGGVEPGAITLDLCQELVDDWILVEESEIAEAMALVELHHDMKIEGAAGVAVAAFLKSKNRLQNGQVAIVICGGNVSEATQGS